MSDSTTATLGVDKEDFAVFIKPELRWGDLDAFNHVNNTVYFRYMESVRIAYFEQSNVLENMRENGCGPILADAYCRFIKPLNFPDKLMAGARVDRVGNTSFQLSYGIWSEKLGLVATGTSSVVFVDYKTGKSLRVPDPIRIAIGSIEKNPVEGL